MKIVVTHNFTRIYQNRKNSNNNIPWNLRLSNLRFYLGNPFFHTVFSSSSLFTLSRSNPT